jgi:hypothetical protein
VTAFAAPVRPSVTLGKVARRQMESDELAFSLPRCFERFDPKRPGAIAGASWQAGVSDDSEDFRVFLNGEPVVSAFAARSGRRGWVLCYAMPEHRRAEPMDRGMDVATPGALERKRLEGHVEIRRTEW